MTQSWERFALVRPLDLSLPADNATHPNGPRAPSSDTERSVVMTGVVLH